LRGQALKQSVVSILAVGAEDGKLVGGIEFTAQQEGECYKDLRLYQDS